MNIGNHTVGVCSWSLRAKSSAELAQKVVKLGLAHVQLALGGLVRRDAAERAAELSPLREAGIELTAGMIGFDGEDYSTIAAIRQTGGFLPDEAWPRRKEITLAAGKLCKELGVRLLTAHLGFIPPSSHEKYKVMLGRVGEAAAELATLGVDLIMETGQERATELLQFLNDLAMRNVGVNFDPANMILYGAGDPIEAIHVLGRHIRHVHVKDATLSDQPGINWGKEMPFGTGQVTPAAFMAALRDAAFTGPLCIEREGGTDRMADIGTAIEALREAVGSGQ